MVKLAYCFNENITGQIAYNSSIVKFVTFDSLEAVSFKF